MSVSDLSPISCGIKRRKAINYKIVTWTCWTNVRKNTVDETVDYLKLCKFVDDESKVEKEHLTTHDSQIGKELADRAQAKHSVEDQVAGDFAKLWKRVVVELDARQVRLFHEDDVQEAFNYSTSLQLRQIIDQVTYVHAGTNCELNNRWTDKLN